MAPKTAEPDPALPIAIRSFLDPAAYIVGAAPEDTLLLTDFLRQRYLREDRDWQWDIRPEVENSLRNCVRRSASLRLILDAHASRAFLAGSVLDLKSGVQTTLVQKGRVGARAWRANDSSDSGAKFLNVEHAAIGSGADIAIGISVSQSLTQMRTYVRSHLRQVGSEISFSMPTGPGQQNIGGGAHAAMLA